MAEDQDCKPRLEIEKFLAMVNRLNDPEVKLRVGEDSVDELLLINFDKLTDYDKVTVLKMAGLYIEPFKLVFSSEVRSDDLKKEEPLAEVIAQNKERRTDDKVAVSKGTKTYITKLAVGLLGLIFIWAVGYILTEFRFADYWGMIKWPWSE